MIESLRGKEVVSISCGGAHSAAITANGELYTWGKGRYGRLGHGDGEDQMRPRIVSLSLRLAFPLFPCNSFNPDSVRLRSFEATK